MYTMKIVLAALLLAAGTASAQQEIAPSTSDGPIDIKPAAPRPESDGVYAAGPGVVAPIVIYRAAVSYPTDAAAESIEGESVLSMVITEAGTTTKIEIVRSHGASFDAAAIAALQQSKFDPGTVNGKPVSVHMFARTRFYADMRPTYPRTLARFGQLSGMASQGFGRQPMLQRGDTPPRAITVAEPEFTDAARKKKIQGVVIVSVLVNEEGVPVDPQIVHSLEPGLDEKAIECALSYRFRPAMHEGAPVAARISIEMNFKIY